MNNDPAMERFMALYSTRYSILTTFIVRQELTASREPEIGLRLALTCEEHTEDLLLRFMGVRSLEFRPNCIPIGASWIQIANIRDHR